MNSPSDYFRIANELAAKGRADEAVEQFKHALAQDPRHFASLNNLGLLLRNRGQLDEAATCFRLMLEQQPDHPFALYSLGDTLRRQGDVTQAEAYFRKALALRPDIAEFHLNLGLLLLSRGEFEEGWKESAWRWRWEGNESVRHNFAQPLWDGSDLAGRTILIYTEQGLGDSIQFVRNLSLVKRRGGRIIFGCEPALLPLFRPHFPVDRWVLPGEVLPNFDVHSPLMNLPMVLGTMLDTIPAEIPYLFAEPQSQQRWKARLARENLDQDNNLKVGLVWAGGQTHPNDRNRSLPLSLLAPILGVPGVQFFSLQTGPPSEQVRSVPAGTQLVDWTKEITDFTDTAGIIANLDLVISVDTSVGHLAGAMGQPVWVLLPFIADWRWMRGRDDSPWYPTMRLFRQSQAGDWREAIESVANVIKHLKRIDAFRE